MRLSAIVIACVATAATGARAEDPLPSWNDGPAKSAIVAFVEKTTTEGSPQFVRPAERIAVFDNDGTLWAEQPAYFQLLFALDRVKAMAADHPEWRTTEPYKSAIAGDLKGVMASGKEGLMKVVAASHAGMTADEFQASAREWLASARNPATGELYVRMVYRPQLELLDYLRDNGFKTFIVSGGGIDFLRMFAERVYGIPPEQVVGTSLQARYELREGVPVIVKEPALDWLDDKEGKPVAIHLHIGRRPILAVGNSDGDFEMLEYTTRGDGPRLGVLIHHDDAEREFAYDRNSPIGRLVRGLDEAPARGWVVVSMKDDWRAVFELNNGT